MTRTRRWGWFSALVRQARNGPPVAMSNWWGKGGMLDWTKG